MKRNILLIYTGGTIGMVEDVQSGSLIPFDFEHLIDQIPELKKFAHLEVKVHSFENPIDSSDMNPVVWAELASLIEKNYHQFDGFVVLHGSDTMSFTASALSFMLKGLNKPVIFTGSQLPIGMIRTDGKENLITALEIASDHHEGIPLVPEVAIYFEYRLYRGNRTHKFNAEHFNAFVSPNYPVLANAGIHIDYDYAAIRRMNQHQLQVKTKTDNHVAVLKLFPGINFDAVELMLNQPGLRGVVMETFGSGNGPTNERFLQLLSDAVDRDIVILNISQCDKGAVMQGRYETSRGFIDAGVIGGSDITFEAAITKMMFVLGNYSDVEKIRELLALPLCGEQS
jgi:L-asparaginase